MICRLPLLIAALALAACADSVLPGPSLEGLPDGLDVQLAVSPGEVGQLGEFTAALTVTNPTADSLRVTTTSGCLVAPYVFRDGARIPFWGSGSPPCLAAITTHVFAPGETVTKTWTLRAELSPLNPGGAHGDPAPAGAYQVRAEFQLYQDEQIVRAGLERTLRVR